LSFVEPGHRWAHSPYPSKAPGISYQGTMKTSVRMSKKPQEVSNCYMVLLPVSSGASVGRLRVSFSLNHDWFACQLQRVEFLRKGSHQGPLFRMFPLSLQSIISNQMRPRRLRGALFSRLLRHPARRRSGSILSPGMHTG